MAFSESPQLRFGLAGVFLLAAVATFLGLARAQGQQEKVSVLHIGSSGSLTASSSSVKEADAIETLSSFLKDETGMDNKINHEKNWQAVVDKLVKQELQIGVFQGYEFAWAQEKAPSLKPLMLAVKFHPYQRAYIVVRTDNKATDFAGLAGQTLSIPAASVGFPELFVKREALAKGKKLDAYFSKISRPEEAEDAIDDIVDGIVQATVVDQTVLETFKRRKPGRFARLKQVAESEPFPPPVIAYKDKDLDAATLDKFRDGLIKASTRERGKKMLTMFRLTAFEVPPADFAKVLAETRKKYPPLNDPAK